MPEEIVTINEEDDDDLISEDKEKLENNNMSRQDVNNELNYLEMLQRLKAEFENYKKRVNKEKEELAVILKSQLITNLLPIIDDFERMFENTPGNENESVKLIFNKLLTILKEDGLEQMECVHKEFNPEYHEAVLVESGTENMNDKILDEIQKGYLFKSKLLRPAKVKVYKKKEVNDKNIE